LELSGNACVWFEATRTLRTALLINNKENKPKQQQNNAQQLVRDTP